MTKSEVIKTWEVNCLPYVKIQEIGVKNIVLRKKSWNNWLDTLSERGNITKEQHKAYK